MARKPTRKSGYKPEFCHQAETMIARAGFREVDLCVLFKIKVRQTLHNWMDEHPEFREAVERGRAVFVNKVEDSLWKRAFGFEYVETTKERDKNTGKMVVTKEVTKFLPPSESSIIFGLKNLAPDKWRDRHEVTGADGGPIPFAVVDFANYGKPAKSA
jgi:hypothetical protein